MGLILRKGLSRNRRRFPELSDNAVKWLEAYRQRGGNMEGPIVTLAETRFTSIEDGTGSAF